jgi:hypothetical protein
VRHNLKTSYMRKAETLQGGEKNVDNHPSGMGEGSGVKDEGNPNG